MQVTRLVARGCLGLSLATLACITPARADDPWSHVDVEIVSDQGEVFPTYPVKRRAGKDLRAYLEARNEARYRIRVHNRAGRRVGLVIAVDGRNIISGARSELERGESMYILDAHESATYEGWRTSESEVHEFYFTDWQDSYAEAFGDRSARGVIAVAVFRERFPVQTWREPGILRKDSSADAEREAAQPAPAAKAEEGARSSSAAGTGFGAEVYSPVRVVDFESERAPARRYIFKYEWRETLCAKRLIDCGAPERNRFWEEDERLGFAPFPPPRVH
jgi:hypothetical protein